MISAAWHEHIYYARIYQMKKVIEKVTNEMSAQEYWGVFFQYLTDKGKRDKINEIAGQEEGIAMASEILLGISKDKAERERLMSEYKYELDTQSKLVHAKREGRKEMQQEIIDQLKSGKSPEEIIKNLVGSP